MCLDYRTPDLCNKQTGRCQWDENGHGCFPAGTVLPCEHFIFEPECTNVGRCEWLDLIKTCVPKDDAIPCKHFSRPVWREEEEGKKK